MAGDEQQPPHQDKPDYWVDAARKLAKFRTLFVQSTSMIFPVLCLAVFVFLYIELLGKPSVECGAAGFYHVVYYVEQPYDSAKTKFVGGLIDGVLILFSTVVLTMLFIILYMKKKPEVILIVIYALLTSISLCSMFYFIFLISRVYHILMDWPSMLVVSINLTSAHAYCIFCLDERKSRAHKVALVFLCVQLSWPFFEMGEWTVWITLLVFGIYDILAVLSVCGPLRWIMNSIGPDMDKYMPGMMFRTETASLGVGDMVFYGVLLMRGFNQGFLVGLACTLGVYFGLAGTLVLTNLTRYSVLPALPLSVFFGTTTYFMYTYCLNPLLRRGLFVI